MGEIVNLRRARKARERSREEAEAAQNRMVSSRTKAEKGLAEAIRKKAERELDAHLAPSDAP